MGAIVVKPVETFREMVFSSGAGFFSATDGDGDAADDEDEAVVSASRGGVCSADSVSVSGEPLLPPKKPFNLPTRLFRKAQNKSWQREPTCNALVLYLPKGNSISN